MACGGFRPPSADDMHVFWGGPRKGEPITNEDMEMFEMAMGRMSCDGVSVDAQYDADKEADDPYSDGMLGDRSRLLLMADHLRELDIPHAEVREFDRASLLAFCWCPCSGCPCSITLWPRCLPSDCPCSITLWPRCTPF